MRVGEKSGSQVAALQKLGRGASLRGQGTPADPARLRSVRARNLWRKPFVPQARKHQKASPRFFSAGVRGLGSTACGFFLPPQNFAGLGARSGDSRRRSQSERLECVRKCEKLKAFTKRITQVRSLSERLKRVRKYEQLNCVRKYEQLNCVRKCERRFPAKTIYLRRRGETRSAQWRRRRRRRLRRGTRCAERGRGSERGQGRLE
jgi:hypothetical protein